MKYDLEVTTLKKYFLIVLAILLFCGCNLIKSNPLIGKWKYSEAQTINGRPVICEETFEFLDNKSFKFTGFFRLIDTNQIYDYEGFGTYFRDDKTITLDITYTKTAFEQPSKITLKFDYTVDDKVLSTTVQNVVKRYYK